MVRLARLESPTGYYHVMVRGHNWETISPFASFRVAGNVRGAQMD